MVGSGRLHQGRGPLRPVHIGQLLQQNLDFLAIGRTLRDKMETLISSKYVNSSMI